MIFPDTLPNYTIIISRIYDYCAKLSNEKQQLHSSKLILTFYIFTKKRLFSIISNKLVKLTDVCGFSGHISELPEVGGFVL